MGSSQVSQKQHYPGFKDGRQRHQVAKPKRFRRTEFKNKRQRTLANATSAVANSSRTMLMKLEYLKLSLIKTRNFVKENPILWAKIENLLSFKSAFFLQI